MFGFYLFRRDRLDRIAIGEAEGRIPLRGVFGLVEIDQLHFFKQGRGDGADRFEKRLDQSRERKRNGPISFRRGELRDRRHLNAGNVEFHQMLEIRLCEKNPLLDVEFRENRGVNLPQGSDDKVS